MACIPGCGGALRRSCGVSCPDKLAMPNARPHVAHPRAALDKQCKLSGAKLGTVMALPDSAAAPGSVNLVELGPLTESAELWDTRLPWLAGCDEHQTLVRAHTSYSPTDGALR